MSAANLASDLQYRSPLVFVRPYAEPLASPLGKVSNFAGGDSRLGEAHHA